ncbi:MAG: hypothetical protein V4592_00580 [Bacteroidota bacterium]
MKVLLRYIIYSAVIVGLAIGCINVFRNHPEVQFAFLMPGLFVIMYSLVRDDIFRRHTSIHLVRNGGTFKGK